MEAQSTAPEGNSMRLTYLLGEDCELRLSKDHKPNPGASLGYTNGWHGSGEGGDSDAFPAQLPEAQGAVLVPHLTGGLGEEVDDEGEEDAQQGGGEGSLYLSVPLPVLDSLSSSDEPSWSFQGRRPVLLPADDDGAQEAVESDAGAGLESRHSAGNGVEKSLRKRERSSLTRGEEDGGEDTHGPGDKNADELSCTAGVDERGNSLPLVLTGPAPTAGQARKLLLWQTLLKAREGTAERKGVSLIPPPESETPSPVRVWRSQAGASASQLAAEGRPGSASSVQRTVPVWVPVDTAAHTTGSASTPATASAPGAPAMPIMTGTGGAGSAAVLELPGLKAGLDGAQGVARPGQPAGKESLQQPQAGDGGMAERGLSPGELEKLSFSAARLWAQARSMAAATDAGLPNGAQGSAGGIPLSPQAWFAQVGGRQLVVQPVLKVTDVGSGRQFIVENWAQGGDAQGTLHLPPRARASALLEGVNSKKGRDAEDREEGGGVRGPTHGSPSLRSRRDGGNLDRRASLSANGGEAGALGASLGGEGGAGRGGQGQARARVGTRLSRSSTRRHSGRLGRPASINRTPRVGSTSGRGTPPGAEEGAALGRVEGGYADEDDGGYEDDDEGEEGGSVLMEGQEVGGEAGTSSLSRRRGRTRSLSGKSGAPRVPGGASEGAAPSESQRARSSSTPGAQLNGDAPRGSVAQGDGGEGRERLGTGVGGLAEGGGGRGGAVEGEAKASRADMSFRDLSASAPALADPTAAEQAEQANAQGEYRGGRDSREGGISAQGSGSAEAAPSAGHSEDLEQEGLQAPGQGQVGRVRTRVRGRKRAALLKAVKRVAGYSGSSLGSSSGPPGAYPGSVSASPAPSSLAGAEDGGVTVALTDRSLSVNDPTLLFPGSASFSLRPPRGPVRAVTASAGSASGAFVGLEDGETLPEFRAGADPFNDGQHRGPHSSVLGPSARGLGMSGGAGAATRAGSQSEAEARGSDSSVPSLVGSEAYRGRARDSSASTGSFTFAPSGGLSAPLSLSSSHPSPAPPARAARTRRMERVKVQAASKKAPVRHLSDLWLVQEVQAHAGAVWALRFSADGRLLATGGQDHVVKLWEIAGVPGTSLATPARAGTGGMALESAPDTPAAQTPSSASSTPAAAAGTPLDNDSAPGAMPPRGWHGPGAATGALEGPRDRSMAHSASDSAVLATARGSGGASVFMGPATAGSGAKDRRGDGVLGAARRSGPLGQGTHQRSSGSSPQLGLGTLLDPLQGSSASSPLVPHHHHPMRNASPNHLAQLAPPSPGSALTSGAATVTGPGAVPAIVTGPGGLVAHHPGYQGSTPAQYSHAPGSSVSFGAAGARALSHSGHYAGAGAGGVPGTPGGPAGEGGGAVWCAVCEHPLRSFTGHTGAVIDLSWSSSCQFVLSASMDKTVRLWHVAVSQCLRVFLHDNYVSCVSFHPRDDHVFLTGSLDGRLRLWSIPGQSVLDWADIHDMVTAATFTDKGQSVLDWADIHDMVTAATFTDKGQAIAVGSYKGVCRFFRISPESHRLVLEEAFDASGPSHKGKKGGASGGGVGAAAPAGGTGRKITGLVPAPLGEDAGSGGEKGRRVLVTSNDSCIRLYEGSHLVCQFKGHKNSSLQTSACLSGPRGLLLCPSEDSSIVLWSLPPALGAPGAQSAPGAGPASSVPPQLPPSSSGSSSGSGAASTASGTPRTPSHSSSGARGMPVRALSALTGAHRLSKRTVSATASGAGTGAAAALGTATPTPPDTASNTGMGASGPSPILEGTGLSTSARTGTPTLSPSPSESALSGGLEEATSKSKGRSTSAENVPSTPQTAGGPRTNGDEAGPSGGEGPGAGVGAGAGAGVHMRGEEKREQVAPSVSRRSYLFHSVSAAAAPAAGGGAGTGAGWEGGVVKEEQRATEHFACDQVTALVLWPGLAPSPGVPSPRQSPRASPGHTTETGGVGGAESDLEGLEAAPATSFPSQGYAPGAPAHSDSGWGVSTPLVYPGRAMSRSGQGTPLQGAAGGDLGGPEELRDAMASLKRSASLGEGVGGEETLAPRPGGVVVREGRAEGVPGTGGGALGEEYMAMCGGLDPLVIVAAGNTGLLRVYQNGMGRK